MNITTVIKQLIEKCGVKDAVQKSAYSDKEGWMTIINEKQTKMDDAFRTSARNALITLVRASSTFAAAASNVIRYWLHEQGKVDGDVPTHMIMINNKAKAFDVDYILIVYIKLMLIYLDIAPMPRYSLGLLDLTYVDDDDIRSRFNSDAEYTEVDQAGTPTKTIKYKDMPTSIEYNHMVSKEVGENGKFVGGIVLGSSCVTWRVKRTIRPRSNSLAKKLPFHFYMPVSKIDAKELGTERFSKRALFEQGNVLDNPVNIDTMESIRTLAASMLIWHANADFDDEDACEREFLMLRKAPPVIIATQKISVGADLPDISAVSVLMDSWDYDKGLIEQVIGRVDRERKGRFVCAEYSALRGEGVLSQDNINHDVAMALTNEFATEAINIMSDPSKHGTSVFMDVLLDTVTPLTIPVVLKGSDKEIPITVGLDEKMVSASKLPWAKTQAEGSPDEHEMRMLKLHEHEGLLFTEVSPITTVKFTHSFYQLKNFTSPHSFAYSISFAFTMSIAHMASRLHMDNPNIRNILTLGIIPECPIKYNPDNKGPNKITDFIPDSIKSRFVMTGNEEDSVTFNVLDLSDMKKGISIPESFKEVAGEKPAALSYSVSGALGVFDFLDRAEQMGRNVQNGNVAIFTSAFLMFAMGFRVYKHQCASQLSEEIESIAGNRKAAGVEKEWLTANDLIVSKVLHELDKLAPAEIEEGTVRARTVRASRDPRNGVKVYKRTGSPMATMTIESPVLSGEKDLHLSIDDDDKKPSGNRRGLFSDGYIDGNIQAVYGAVRTLDVLRGMRLYEVKKLDTQVHREQKTTRLFYDLLDVVQVVTEWRKDMSHEGADFYGKREDAQLFVSPVFRYMCGVCSVIKEGLLDRIPMTPNKADNDKMKEAIVNELVSSGCTTYSVGAGKCIEITKERVNTMPFRAHPFFKNDACKTEMEAEREAALSARTEKRTEAPNDMMDGLE